jgi:hypothetical protein
MISPDLIETEPASAVHQLSGGSSTASAATALQQPIAIKAQTIPSSHNGILSNIWNS